MNISRLSTSLRTLLIRTESRCFQQTSLFSSYERRRKTSQRNDGLREDRPKNINKIIKKIENDDRLDTYFPKFIPNNQESKKQISIDRSDILFIDDDIMALNKPPGLLTQSDIQNDSNNLKSFGKKMIREHFTKVTNYGSPYLTMINRLDRPSSGLCIFGRNAVSTANLSKAMVEKKINKIYLAVVQGKLTGRGTLENVIEEVGSGGGNYSICKDVTDENLNRKKGKLAILNYKVLHNFEVNHKGFQSLVQVQIITGRKHQIRAQLSKFGFPVVGDVKYGAPTQMRNHIIALHAFNYTFQHPKRRDRIEVTAPIPEIWYKLFPEEAMHVANEDGKYFRVLGRSKQQIEADKVEREKKLLEETEYKRVKTTPTDSKKRSYTFDYENIKKG